MTFPKQLMILCLGAVLLPGCVNGMGGQRWGQSTRPTNALVQQPFTRPAATGVDPAAPVVVIRQAPKEQPPIAPAVNRSTEPPAGIEAAPSPREPVQPPQSELHPVHTRKESVPVFNHDPAPEESKALFRALRAYLESRPTEAIELLQAYPPRHQDMLLTLLPIIAQVEEKKGNWPEQLDDGQKLAVIQSLRSLKRMLELSAPLVVSKLDFAHEVKSFGKYTALAKAEFRPGDQVSLYMEVENVRDRHVKEEEFVARLSSTLLIRGEHSNMGWTQAVKSTPDLSHSDRDDHFAVIRFRMPPDTKPGVYYLLLRLVDQDTNRKAERGITFRIVSSTPER